MKILSVVRWLLMNGKRNIYETRVWKSYVLERGMALLARGITLN